MKPSQALDAHRADIRRVVAENRAANARVFGSVLRQADTEVSDLDIVVDPTADTTHAGYCSHSTAVAEAAGYDCRCIDPEGVARKLSRSNPCRSRARMTKKDDLRIADYLSHMIEAIPESTVIRAASVKLTS
jgi:predicted nucleotidyltransferase